MPVHYEIEKTVGGVGQFTLPRPGIIDLVFTGEHIVQLREVEVDEADDYRGAKQLSRSITLYKADKKSYILIRSDRFPYLLATPEDVLRALENGADLGEFEKCFLVEAAALDAGMAAVSVEVI